jgi:hypothetical protein
MAVVRDKPLWYRPSENNDWTELTLASEYPIQDANHMRRGRFDENLLTYCFIVSRGVEYVWAYVGGDASTGIFYDYTEFPDVAHALENIDKYADFLSVLSNLGYDLLSAVTQDAIRKLQSFVDLANE